MLLSLRDKRSCGWQHLFKQLRAADHAGDAGTRMGSGADEKEVLHVLADVVGTEPGALSEDGFELEGGAEVDIEVRLEVFRRPDDFADDVLSQIGTEAFQRGENRIGVAFLYLLPIDFSAQVRNGREDIKALTAGRSQRRIGPG